MLKRIINSIDSMLYHVFGYVSKERRRRWCHSLNHFKSDTLVNEGHHRALLIYSRANGIDYISDYIEDE